jgi:hypothetical protein
VLEDSEDSEGVTKKVFSEEGVAEKVFSEERVVKVQEALWDTDDSEEVASDGRSFSEKEVVRRSLTAKDVSKEIEVKKAVHDQVNFREKAQREDCL